METIFYLGTAYRATLHDEERYLIITYVDFRWLCLTAQYDREQDWAVTSKRIKCEKESPSPQFVRKHIERRSDVNKHYNVLRP